MLLCMSRVPSVYTDCRLWDQVWWGRTLHRHVPDPRGRKASRKRLTLLSRIRGLPGQSSSSSSSAASFPQQAAGRWWCLAQVPAAAASLPASPLPSC
ncbi:hypothetical protein O3P69_013593 [Scylla paramamosain]|uniref:Uncharacterized protein n=1 Tax=Scylla paramamosain TaxID=85552 RepID=A0AAW0SPI0_SCYPA